MGDLGRRPRRLPALQAARRSLDSICGTLLIAFSRAAKAWDRQRGLQYLRRGFVVTNGEPHWKQ